MHISKLPQYSIILAIIGALIATPLQTLSAEKHAVRATPDNDEKIVHVLNRLGYGPRPGDIERVKKLGLDKYIDQQLNPEKIDDREMETRLGRFETLKMS